MYTEQRINEKMPYEASIDLDWYFVDKDGQVAIVASGGGLLPDAISLNTDKLKKTISFFRSLPVISNEIVINDAVYDKIRSYTLKQKETYLKDLKEMTSKGLYYFDKLILNNYLDFRYFLKAKPVVPLILDMKGNTEIGNLSLLEVDCNLSEITYFSVNEL